VSRTPVLAAALLLVSAVVAPVVGAAPQRAPGRGPAPVDVQIVALNDFHGALEALPSLVIDPATNNTSTNPARNPRAVPAGGAEYLATHVRRLEAANPNTTVVSAGDLVGASPLLSALFRDEPTIEAMNLIGLDYNAVGNHEFDEGAAELVRLQEGGCHPEDGCRDGDPYAGADFDFLAANVVDAEGDTLFPPYAIETYQGARVAYIGMTLEGTPSIVSPAGIQGLSFLDEADTVNALVGRLRRQVDAIVVLLHEGGVQTAPGGITTCNGLQGPIVDIVDRMSDEVDLVVSGHTHTAYDCVFPDGTVVTSASAGGRVLTDIDLRIDRRLGEVTSISTTNFVVTREVGAAGDVTALITRYRDLAAPLANRVIGTAAAPISRAANAAGESALGDVIADAQLDATSAPELGGARIAFMNPGGIRTDLQQGEITYAEAFEVQPFGNNLVTLTLTGAQIERVLEQQFCNPSGTASQILQVSRGFSYAWDDGHPCGDRVDPASITLDGVVLDPAGTYRVTVNSFLADGGDGFRVFTEGTDRLGGVVDLDALEAYLEANDPVQPGPQDRIRLI
jgi:5'-nucleotidase